MVHVYYHYANGYGRYGMKCKHFPTRRDADRWCYFMRKKYPTFQMDEFFDETERMPQGLIRL